MSTLTTSSSDQLLGRAKRVLAAGALGRFSIPDEVSVVFESGSGSRLRSVDGDVNTSTISWALARCCSAMRIQP